MLPWQAGVGVAVVLYLVLHHFATRPPLPFNPVELKAMGKTMGDVATHTMVGTFSTFLQYALPFFVLLGALSSFVRRRRQRALHAELAATPRLEALERLSWREFEELVAETFRQQGYRVIERGGDGPDGGVDVELAMGRDKYLVQCKQWKAAKVGVAVVRELFGVMHAEGAVGGFVVAAGEFTEEAKRFAEGRSIRLVPAEALLRWISPAKVGRPTPTEAAPTTSTPACPKCGKSMVLRRAKQGANAGNEFWGCSDFPSCRGIRQI